MAPDGSRQSRLDAFRPAPNPVPEPMATPAEAPEPPDAPDEPAREPPTETKMSGETGKPLPPVTREDEARVHKAIIEGLEAAGFQEPRVTLRLCAHSSLRASLSQDRAGRIVPGERLTLEMTDAYCLAPERALAGLGASLGLSVLRRKKTNELSRLLIEYHDLWQRSREGRALQSRVRRQRARKQGRGPHGAAHDLEQIKARLVERFFAGRVDDVELTWSSREGYTTLGHHDGDLDTIVVNRCLDHADVPESVVGYILYHELLHHTLGIQEAPGGRRTLHPPSFRRRERRFPNWPIADKYLESLCTRRRPTPYRRAPTAWRVLWDEPWDRPQTPGKEPADEATNDRQGQAHEEGRKEIPLEEIPLD